MYFVISEVLITAFYMEALWSTSFFLYPYHLHFCSFGAAEAYRVPLLILSREGDILGAPGLL